MTQEKQYKCVNCGVSASELYRVYSPTVLKLSKCGKCKGIVDKYIEYDPVIVMIDLVLMSKEAQRHIIYNTDFKSYWKLLIILIMLETYGVWRNDSLFNIAINTFCDIRNNNTINSTHIALPINLTIHEPWKSECKGWANEEKDTPDLFIWERDFYILFLSVFAGIFMFISTVHLLMTMLKLFSTNHEASVIQVLKSFCLANMSILFTVPILVWGNTNTTPETRLCHYSLVHIYGFIVFYNVLCVLYDGPRTATAFVLLTSNSIKYLTIFHMTSIIRHLLS